jgi:hypothetical protein
VFKSRSKLDLVKIDRFNVFYYSYLPTLILRYIASFFHFSLLKLFISANTDTQVITDPLGYEPSCLYLCPLQPVQTYRQAGGQCQSFYLATGPQDNALCYGEEVFGQPHDR